MLSNSQLHLYIRYIKKQAVHGIAMKVYDGLVKTSMQGLAKGTPLLHTPLMGSLNAETKEKRKSGRDISKLSETATI